MAGKDVTRSDSRFTRRQLFKETAGVAAGVGAAGALAQSTPAGAAAARSPLGPYRTLGTLGAADVVIVGAGISGLYAARLLRQAGHSVVVVEARNRVGGRILATPIGQGQLIEEGAEFIAANDSRLRQLVKDLNIATYPTFADGDIVLDIGGQSTAAGNVPLNEAILGTGSAALAAAATLQAMADTINIDNPAATPNAADWDQQTLYSWLQTNVSDAKARTLLGIAMQGLYAGTTSDASLLHTMFAFQVHGGIVATASVQGGSQQDRVVGTTSRIVDALASQLKGHLILNAPVRVIDQSGSQVVVATDRGSVKGKAVIMALPPTLAGRIQYDPLLPGMRDQFTQRMPMGYIMKVQTVYPEPFWREKGLAGTAVSDTGPVTLSFDNSPNGAKATQGVLLGFIFADNARTWGPKPEAVRRSAVLQQFSKWFGPQAASPTSYFEQNWTTEQWTRGYVGYMPTDVWVPYGSVVRAPVGRIHWAGTETGQDGMGAMEGGLQAAQRAVGEIIG